MSTNTSMLDRFRSRGDHLVTYRIFDGFVQYIWVNSYFFLIRKAWRQHMGNQKPYWKLKTKKTGRTKQWPQAVIRLTYCKIKQVFEEITILTININTVLSLHSNIWKYSSSVFQLLFFWFQECMVIKRICSSYII